MEITYDEYTDALEYMAVCMSARELVGIQAVRDALLQHFGLVEIEATIWRLRILKVQRREDALNG